MVWYGMVWYGMVWYVYSSHQKGAYLSDFLLFLLRILQTSIWTWQLPYYNIHIYNIQYVFIYILWSKNPPSHPHHHVARTPWARPSLQCRFQRRPSRRPWRRQRRMLPPWRRRRIPRGQHHLHVLLVEKCFVCLCTIELSIVYKIYINHENYFKKDVILCVVSSS